MRRYLALLFAVLFLFGCNTPHYTVSGRLDALPGDSLYLLAQYRPDSVLAAGVVGSDSLFVLKGRMMEPMVALLKVIGGQEFIISDIFLEPGEISISVAVDGVVVSGTPLNDSLSLLKGKLRAVRDTYRSMPQDIRSEERMALEAQLSRLSLDMAGSNEDNLLGLYLLEQYEFPRIANSPDSAAIAAMTTRLDRFSAALQHNPTMLYLRKNLAAVGNTLIGKPFTDFSAEDSAGNGVALSSLVGLGRWVLLDFWATWCRPCVDEIPYLHEAYAAYNEKGFTIYGVSLDNDQERWAAFVAENKLPWINVQGVGADKQSIPAALYVIRCIPSNFLISPEGIIVAKNLRGEALQRELAQRIR